MSNDKNNDESEQDEIYSNLPVVHLLPAYAWICEDCNRLNFQQFEDGGIEAREMVYRIMYGLDEHEELPRGWDEQVSPDGLVVAPKVVTCIGCKTTFATSMESLESMLQNLEDEFFDDEDEYGYDDEDEFDDYGDGESFYRPDWDDV